MPTENYFHIKYEKTELWYQKFGNGSKTLLAFHGYGQESGVISPIAEALNEDYTTYSFDLFFHGKSRWQLGEKPLEKIYWKTIIEEFIRENNITAFSLLGYSIGAKFLLTTFEHFTNQIGSIFLIAPDGIKTNTWYSLATYPYLLRRLFKATISNPNLLFGIMKLLHWTKALDKGLMKFVRLEMNTIEKRKRVYFSWVVFRHLSFDVSALAEKINGNNISTTIIIGQFDKIITKDNLNNFIDMLDHPQLVMLPCGHNQLLTSAAAAYNPQSKNFTANSKS